jgi:hypothetical protein
MTLTEKKGNWKSKAGALDFTVWGIRIGKKLWICHGIDCGMMNDDSPNRAKGESFLRFLDNVQLDTTHTL